MPPRLAELNAKWEAGRADWLARQATARRNASRQAAAASRPAPPDAALGSRRNEILYALGSVLAHGKPGTPAVISHLAFSKRGLAALEKAFAAKR
jgi:hypothetical protein